MNDQQIWSLRKLWWFVVFGESLAIGAQAFNLWQKRNAVWWVFVSQAVSLALVCGVTALALYCIWRARKNEARSTSNPPTEEGA